VTPWRTGVCGGRRAGGLAYIALLVALAMLALAAAGTARLGASTHRHAAEAALLDLMPDWLVQLTTRY
jgi:hypothetical protein